MGRCCWFLFHIELMFLKHGVRNNFDFTLDMLIKDACSKHGQVFWSRRSIMVWTALVSHIKTNMITEMNKYVFDIRYPPWLIIRKLILFDIDCYDHLKKWLFYDAWFGQHIRLCHLLGRYKTLGQIYSIIVTRNSHQKIQGNTGEGIKQIVYIVHCARVIQRLWRRYLDRKMKKHIAEISFSMEMSPEIARVIYDHSRP